MKMKRIFMTGATGYFGSRILKELLAHDWECTLLIRGHHIHTPEDRLKQSLLDVGVSPETIPWQRITVVQGCLNTPDVAQLLDLSNTFTCFLHAAAIVKTACSESDIFSSNVLGTASMLNLAKAVRAEHFIYVSTAYSCGKASRDSKVLSVANEETKFSNYNNFYEESKNSAEELVKNSSLPWTIIRPSILTHASPAEATTSGVTIGLAGWFKLIERCSQIALRAGQSKLVIPSELKTPLNFIDVTVAAKILQSICECVYDDRHGAFIDEEFLLTSRSGTTTEMVYHIASTLLKLPIVGKPNHTPITTAEKFYVKQGSFFVSYTNQFLKFDRTKLEKAFADHTLLRVMDQVDTAACARSVFRCTDSNIGENLIDTLSAPPILEAI